MNHSEFDQMELNQIEGPVSTEAKIQYWFLLLLIVPAITLFGNSLVVLSVLRERSLRNATNWFIVSLATADIILAILVMPVATSMEMSNGRWTFGNVMCNIFVMLDVLFCTASILNLVAISLDRYIAVTQPINYAKRDNLCRVQLSIAAVWIVSLLLSLPVVCGINDLGIVDPSVCQSRNALYIIISSVGSFYLPAIVLLALYHRIFTIIRERHKPNDRTYNRARLDSTAINDLKGLTQSVGVSLLSRIEEHENEPNGLRELVPVKPEQPDHSSSVDNSPSAKDSQPGSDYRTRRDTDEISSNESMFDGPREDIQSPYLVSIECPSKKPLGLQSTVVTDGKPRQCLSMPQLISCDDVPFQIFHSRKISHSANSLYNQPNKANCLPQVLLRSSFRKRSSYVSQRSVQHTTSIQLYSVEHDRTTPQSSTFSNGSGDHEIVHVHPTVKPPFSQVGDLPMNGNKHLKNIYTCFIDYNNTSGYVSSTQINNAYAGQTRKICPFRCCMRILAPSNESSSYSNDHHFSDSLFSSSGEGSEEYSDSRALDHITCEHEEETCAQYLSTFYGRTCSFPNCIEPCFCQLHYGCQHDQNPSLFLIPDPNEHPKRQQQSQRDKTNERNEFIQVNSYQKPSLILTQCQHDRNRSFLSEHKSKQKFGWKSRVQKQRRFFKWICSLESCTHCFQNHQKSKSTLTLPSNIQIAQKPLLCRIFCKKEQCNEKKIPGSWQNLDMNLKSDYARDERIEKVDPGCPNEKPKRRVSFWILKQRFVSNREKKATKTLAIVLGAFLMCWLPFFTVNVTIGVCILHDTFKHPICAMSSQLMSACTWLGYVNSLLNPIIYTIFNLEFRAAFKRLLRIK